MAEGSQVVGLVCGGRRCYPAFTAIALRRHQDIHHNGQSTHDSHHVAQPHGRESNPTNALSCCVETKKPKALTSGLNSSCRQSKLWRRYQIYMKYMRFSSVLQDLHPNLSPFVVNVIALLR
nr:MAG TPA: hypothetical protein [Caudoviricetes sp.]